MLINIKQLKLHVKTSHERKYLLPNKTFLNIVTVLSRLQINDVAKISMLKVKRGMSIVLSLKRTIKITTATRIVVFWYP